MIHGLAFITVVLQAHHADDGTSFNDEANVAELLRKAAAERALTMPMSTLWEAAWPGMWKTRSTRAARRLEAVGRTTS